jgi:hypothetical protein
MCLTRVPVPTSCPATVTLLLTQIKALPYVQQAALLDQLHELLYNPFRAVLLSGPKL